MISTQPYKGSRDFYPHEMRIRNWFFKNLTHTTESFGFERIDAPILEPVDIYLLKTSEEIINQQIYSFEDRGGRKIAMRPEMTPTVSRMVAGKFRELSKPIRWYSLPNLWRYERPGKGRLREHWQLNADIFAATDEFAADCEILQLAISLLKNLGAQKGNFMVHLNHRGVLNQFLNNMVLVHEPEKHTEIARIFDKKEKIPTTDFDKMLLETGISQLKISLIHKYLENGLDFLKKNHNQLFPSSSRSTVSKTTELNYLFNLIQLMKSLNMGGFIKYDPSVVRGFDYYTGLVFEVFDTHPDNKRSIFGGGRYNNLVSGFTKTKLNCNAVGFGMGDVTLEDFLTVHNLIKKPNRKTQIYVVCFNNSNDKNKEITTKNSGQTNSFQLASLLREQGFSVEVSLGDKKIKKQFEEAHQKNIPFVVLQGEDELKNNLITIKELATGNQKQLSFNELVKYLKSLK